MCVWGGEEIWESAWRATNVGSGEGGVGTFHTETAAIIITQAACNTLRRRPKTPPICPRYPPSPLDMEPKTPPRRHETPSKTAKTAPRSPPPSSPKRARAHRRTYFNLVLTFHWEETVGGAHLRTNLFLTGCFQLEGARRRGHMCTPPLVCRGASRQHVEGGKCPVEEHLIFYAFVAHLSHSSSLI